MTILQKAHNDPAEVARLLRDYPTRVFRCGRWGSAANVVYKNDVILLAAHSLYDEDCELNSTAKNNSCRLTDYSGDGHVYELDMKTLISGVQLLKAANKDCRFDRYSRRDDPSVDAADWAVVKLTKPMQGVRPYDLFASPLSDEGIALTLVASKSPNLMEMNFQVCRWMNTKVVDGRIDLLKTDCDGGPGMSGSALVSDRRQIVGILIGGIRDPKLPDRSPYDEVRNCDINVPITDEFIRAARTVAGLSQD